LCGDVDRISAAIAASAAATLAPYRFLSEDHLLFEASRKPVGTMDIEFSLSKTGMAVLRRGVVVCDIGVVKLDVMLLCSY